MASRLMLTVFIQHKIISIIRLEISKKLNGLEEMYNAAYTYVPLHVELPTEVLCGVVQFLNNTFPDQ